MEKKTAEEILKDHYSFCSRGYCEQMPHINELIQIIQEYSSLQSEEKDKEIERLREACKTVVNGYETDGMEQMQTRDHVFYKKCKAALSNQPIESDKDRRIKELEDMLHDAAIQIEYLHIKNTATGSGNAVLSRIKAMLNIK